MAKDHNLPAPECLALVLCEQVIQDLRTKNLTLVNIFNTIAAPFRASRPRQHERLSIFVSLTNGRGNSRGKLIVHDAEGNEVFHGEGDVRFPDPVAVVEMTFDIRGLPLPSDGEYRIQFWCDDSLVGQRCFRVVRATKGSKGQSEGA